jgi:inner membrane protein
VGNKIISKLITIAAISVALLIPLFLIGAQISGRSFHQAEVLHEIANSSAGSQTVLGPVCVVHYHEMISHIDRDKATDKETVHQQVVERDLVLPPQNLDISGEVRVETRSRGIYHARLFHSALKISGNFELPAGFSVDRSKILDAEAFLVMAVSDPRGISNDPVALINGKENRFSTGTIGLGDRPGARISLGAIGVAQSGHFEFSFPLNLMGTEQLSFAPVGTQTTVALKSDWRNPSFQGRFLPVNRTVNNSGFEARWQVSALARSFDQVLKTSPVPGDQEIMGVGFLEPVNVYSMSQRAVTYGILFVVLTFAAFFMTEILRQLRIHPLQYLLVGLALAIFFLLLIALSEHVPFLIAYAVSAIACVSLIGIYLTGVLREKRLGVQFGAGIAVLYSILYGVLLSEDNALLMGTALLFAALGLIMLATRKIDWYQAALSSANEPPAQVTEP